VAPEKIPGPHPRPSWLDYSPACNLSNSDCPILPVMTLEKEVEVKDKKKVKEVE
jgi:hypothetical protein